MPCVRILPSADRIHKNPAATVPKQSPPSQKKNNEKDTFLSLAKHCDVKVYGGTEVRPLSFLTLVLIAFRR